jgi:protein TonB
MAYLTSRTDPAATRRRIVALGAVGAVHGVLAVALLTGFAGGIIQAIKRDPLKAWTYMPPLPKPSVTPEPAPQPSARPSDTVTKHDEIAPIDLTTGRDILITLDPMPPAGGDLGPTFPPPLPTASPGPRFAPRTAAPLGTPGRWVSDGDYPSAALHRGEQGAAGFEVTIGPDGRVRDCRITRSSGSTSLDNATCANVSERARFNPARDENGEPVVGRYANVIRWRIPE